jgi:hypothetical protein
VHWLLQSILFLCDILPWQAQEEAETLEAAAALEEVRGEVLEVEVSEVADQEVEQEEEAEEAEASSSVNGARTGNLTVLGWLKMAKKMSTSFLALQPRPSFCLDM